MDFVDKNFVYRTMPFKELVERVAGQDHRPLLSDDFCEHTPPVAGVPAQASEPGRACSQRAEQCGGYAKERYYLRSLGHNRMKEVSDLHRGFPELARDVVPPPLFPPSALFSSVLRVSSPGLQLWTHYDVMDNLLMQVKGVKRVLLWPPAAAEGLYVQQSSSPITRPLDPDLTCHPKYAALTPPLLCVLRPGQALFLPALWLHHVTTLSPAECSCFSAMHCSVHDPGKQQAGKLSLTGT
ncbi:tRNA wybutosine-synthesizing 5 [Haematococcus lacustris]|uniref:tRNA wybutosine-synthesizing 5 n=1 Tax=Haematococcus lacustris TaxID=44745 RepID=A0A6A0ACD5_HAELA|nr:tRNA wybutosine-synthesizing 5 [Haematococcus lacustris]